MPKMKTHSGAKKRIKVTGKGKFIRGHAFNNHMFGKKSSTRKRRLDSEVEIAPADRRQIKRLLGR